MYSSLAPFGPRTRNSLMSKVPARVADGIAGPIVMRPFAFLAPPLSPARPMLIPPVLAGAEGATRVGAALFTKVSSPPVVASAGENTGGVTTTGVLRAVLCLRFELFFLAATPICRVNRTSTVEIAMIDIRTGLRIFDSPFSDRQ